MPNVRAREPVRPEIGALASVRDQRWMVSEVEACNQPTLVGLQSVEGGGCGDTLEVICEIERGCRVLPSGSLPEVTASGFDGPAAGRLDDFPYQEFVHRAQTGKGAGRSTGYPNLCTPEWEIFSADRLPEIGDDRLDAPDPDDPELVTSAPLSRDAPTWVPASEVRGEGIFLRVDEDLLTVWERRVADSPALHAHRDAYARFRSNRYSGRIAGPFDPMRLWPGARYIALHTLSHLLIRTIALECGYNSASLSERIYAGSGDEPRSGILIYTAVPDAEGTLGGLVSLSEPDNLMRLTRRTLADARHCSSDPLCAERLPAAPADFLHGAACHVCLFVSETTCERGNRFLDRRFVVPVADAEAGGGAGDSLALYPDLP